MKLLSYTADNGSIPYKVRIFYRINFFVIMKDLKRYVISMFALFQYLYLNLFIFFSKFGQLKHTLLYYILFSCNFKAYFKIFNILCNIVKKHHKVWILYLSYFSLIIFSLAILSVVLCLSLKHFRINSICFVYKHIMVTIFCNFTVGEYSNSIAKSTA